MKIDIMEMIQRLPAIILVLTVHEFSHGFIAYKLGDTTAKTDGRLSLNPLKHVDLFGLLAMVVFRFGWAKPVNVNPGNFKNPKVDMALTAAAGPVSNIIFSFILLLIYIPLAIKTNNVGFIGVVRTFLLQCSSISLSLGFFNMIPIPPLDGSKIFGACLPDRLYFKYTSMGNLGMIILLVLLSLDKVSEIMTPIILITLEGMYFVAGKIFSFMM